MKHNETAQNIVGVGVAVEVGLGFAVGVDFLLGMYVVSH